MEIRKLPKEDFPVALLEIPQPPENLWIMGDLPLAVEKQVYLCVVGSRKNTSYGRDACEKIISGLRGYPIVIVSGFAMGIDTIAHKVALKTGLKTVVFPGSGLSEEVMYPKMNSQLVQEILDGGGCILSEFEPKFRATLWSFPQRNRLMAGISKATLVIEAAEKSGTLITARMALEYNRDLLAVPGSIFLPTSKGSNKLIRQGAISVASADEVLEALGFTNPRQGIRDKEMQAALFSDLSIEEKKVMDILREPLPRDELIRAIQASIEINISAANVLLSVMEIKELIKEEMGEIRLF